MIEGMLVGAVVFLFGFVSYCMGRRDLNMTRRTGPETRGGGHTAYRAPPPPHITQHKPGCPVRQEWERQTRCQHCDNRLSHPPRKGAS